MKHPKILSLMMASVIAATGVLPAGAYAAANGDFDGNGVLTSDDLALLQDHILAKKTLTSEQAKLADINGDGTVDVHDVAELRKLILKTDRDLQFKKDINRVDSSLIKDEIKKLAIDKGDVVVTSSAELKTELTKYFADSIVNNLLTKYDDKFFADSVLLLKPV